MDPLDRRSLLAAVGAGTASLAGCLGRSGPTSAETTGVPPTEPAASGPPSSDRAQPHAYTPAELEAASRSGGPPPDGIPAIEEPQFTAASSSPASLAADDPVFGVSLGDEPKAYPQAILVQHEIVNDVVDDIPVAVTYCPLTGTAQGFYRGETTFGVSGQLINANLVMYDRAEEHWWPQVLGRRITGPDPGELLAEFPVTWTTWERWRSRHPETVVLTDETGFARNYGSDPYGGYNPPSGYYASDGFIFPPMIEDDRLAPKTVVIGMRSARGAVAVGKDRLRTERILRFDLGGLAHAAVYDNALDTGYVYRLEEPSGTTTSPGAEATLSWAGGQIAVDGERYAAGAMPFARELAFDAMWFAWYGYYPMTALLT